MSPTARASQPVLVVLAHGPYPFNHRAMRWPDADACAEGMHWADGAPRPAAERFASLFPWRTRIPLALNSEDTSGAFFMRPARSILIPSKPKVGAGLTSPGHEPCLWSAQWHLFSYLVHVGIYVPGYVSSGAWLRLR